MKNLLKTGWLILAVLTLLVACNKEKEEEILDNSVEGIYAGTLTEVTTKSAGGNFADLVEATAEVTLKGEEEIEVHCYSDELDTTFMLNYYENHDSVMVCLTGDDFEEMYGHMMGEGHMMGGMMGDISDGETEWQHHMDDEHQPGDEHFGGFDIMDHSFTYTFEMMNGNNPYKLRFQGTKQ